MQKNPFTVENIPPMRLIGGTTNKEILVAVINTVGLPVEEALDDIGMKSKKVGIHTECDIEASWVRSLEELWTNQSVYQWVD